MISPTNTISGFLKNPIRVLRICRRNLYKPPAVWKERLKLGKPDFQYFEKSKLKPEGYELIYVTPMYSVLKWTTAIVPFMWAGFCFDTYRFFTDEDYIKKKQKVFPNFSYKEKILQIGLIAAFLVTVHAVQMRVVGAIYRNKKQYKTVMFGFFGTWHKKLVSHGPNAMESTRNGPLFIFQNKHVFLFYDGFRNMEDVDSILE